MTSEKQPIPPPSEPPPSYELAAQHGQKPTGRPPRGPLPLEYAPIVALRDKRVILASQSPRRRQLLGQILPNIEIIPSTFEENIPKRGLSPFEYVLQTATAKALAVYQSEIQLAATSQKASQAQQSKSNGIPAATTDDGKTDPLLPTAPKGDPDLIVAADTIVVGYDGQILEKPRSEKQHIDMLFGLRDGGPSAQPRSGGDSKNSVSPADAVAAMISGGAEAGLGPGIRGEGALMARGPVAASDATGLKEGVWHKVFTAVAVLAPLESARDPGYALETVVEETSVKFDPNMSDELIMAYIRTREGVDKAGGYGMQGIGSLLVERIDGPWDNVVGMPLRSTLVLIEKVLAIAAEDEEDVEGSLIGEDD